MENATKALIISASILIAIIIIALGLKFLTSSKDAIKANEDNSSKTESSMFNSKYEKYEGNAVRGIQVKTLASMIIQNNEANIIDKNAENTIDKYDNNKVIHLQIADSSEYISQTDINNWLNTSLEINATYKVKITEFNSKNGHVKKIQISKN